MLKLPPLAPYIRKTLKIAKSASQGPMKMALVQQPGGMKGAAALCARGRRGKTARAAATANLPAVTAAGRTLFIMEALMMMLMLSARVLRPRTTLTERWCVIKVTTENRL
jgi:hypothetical protein